MKTFIITVAVIFSFQAPIFAQVSINDYKYVIIPSKFDFQSEEDQYQLNSLAHFLFNKHGYTAFLQNDDLPEDLKMDRCRAMSLDVDDEKGGMFKTKLQMHLRDCNGTLIMSSQIGETREKEYSKAYKIALREAFETFKNIDYNYQILDRPSEQNELVTPSKIVVKDGKEHPETERLAKEIKSAEKVAKDNQQQTPTVVVSAIPNMDASEISLGKTNSNQALDMKATLYAQPIENGYQLVDTQPRKVMVLLNTGLKDVYLVEGRDALVYYEDGFWFYSENKDELKIEKIDIKF